MRTSISCEDSIRLEWHKEDNKCETCLKIQVEQETNETPKVVIYDGNYFPSFPIKDWPRVRDAIDKAITYLEDIRRSA